MTRLFSHIVSLFGIFSLIMLQSGNAINSSVCQWETINTKKGPTPRDDSGYALIRDGEHQVSRSTYRIGELELVLTEGLKRTSQTKTNKAATAKEIPVQQQWHTLTLSFDGPEVSEDDYDNPFLNYRLSVEFKHKNKTYQVRGFFAADGHAAETGANQGHVWKVKFTPDVKGTWHYSAKLHYGNDIALENDLNKGTLVELSNSEGQFLVMESDKQAPDFRANGRLLAFKGFYKFQDSEKFWIKGGTNSPENLLGYEDFDNTYRLKTSNRDGEAKTTTKIHTYEAHLKDWKPGDPTWNSGKGKSLIGGVNYLASKGMNSIYFLVMNILGDGKDVWPFNTPEDFSRFDVSKLEQWEIVFQHMQSKGMLLHIVLQETENETLFDDGNTGATRKLFLRELIARFGHHLALNWNLGEENGPASWSPLGQNDRQRKDMAKFLKLNDPYKHPVLLHTHAHDPLRSKILDSILGFEYLDGLSLQQDKREFASEVVETWRKKSKAKGHDWLITMDEIGMWHTAALPDKEDPNHDTLRRYALWGTLLSGAAGVEWYFGAKYPHNDLNSEDWRERDRLWELTKYATEFFQKYIPFWDMTPKHNLINTSNAYCLGKTGDIYAVYLPQLENPTINLKHTQGVFHIAWYNPLKGGPLLKGSKEKVHGGAEVSLGLPPSTENSTNQQDWVCLVSKVNN